MTDRHHLRACHTTQKLLYGYDWGAPKDTLDERLEGDGVTAKSLRTLAIGYHKYPRKTNQGRDGHDAGQMEPWPAHCRAGGQEDAGADAPDAAKQERGQPCKDLCFIMMLT
jgi:hypothetical protein